MAQEVEHVLGKDEVAGSTPAISSMLADEKAARQKPGKTVRFSRFFAVYAAKTCAYETWGKDNILWLLFCELSKKQDLNCRLW